MRNFVKKLIESIQPIYLDDYESQEIEVWMELDGSDASAVVTFDLQVTNELVMSADYIHPEERDISYHVGNFQLQDCYDQDGEETALSMPEMKALMKAVKNNIQSSNLYFS